MDSALEDFIKHTLDTSQKAYDKYVNLYNKSDSKLNAVSSLLKIQNHFDKNKLELKESIENRQGLIIRSILRAYPENPENNSFKKEYLEVDLKNFFDPIFKDNTGIGYIDKDRESVDKKIKALELKFKKDSQRRVLQSSIEEIFKKLHLLQTMTNDSRPLESLIRKIIVEGYPEKLELYKDISNEEKEEIAKVGNRDWIEQAYIMPEGFYDKARIYTKKGKWDQRSIYDQLITDFKNKWNGKKPSFATVHRRLKENNIW